MERVLSKGLVIFAVFCISNGEDGYLPPYIKPCNIEDKGFSSCVREQIEASLSPFTKGIPELGVPSLDPVRLDDIKIDGQGLKLTFSDPVMHGISKAKVMNFNVEIGKDVESFSLTFKTNFLLVAKYEIDGKILVLPIQGKGDSKVKANNVEVQIDSKLTHIKDSRGTHFKLVSPSYKYDIENTKFEFENLFNGNKQLSDVTHQFANENWKQLMDDLAPPVIKQIVRTCVKSINKFFSKVPISQIVQNYKET